MTSSSARRATPHASSELRVPQSLLSITAGALRVAVWADDTPYIEYTYARKEITGCACE
jgi:hypothetical protein